MLKTYKVDVKIHYKNHNFASSNDNKTNIRPNFMFYWADSTQPQEDPWGTTHWLTVKKHHVCVCVTPLLPI
jgi:hypothetical protein